MKGEICLFVVLLCSLTQAAFGAGDSAGEILEASNVKGGLVVAIGCDDPNVLTDLGRRDAYLVHGLDTDRAKVEKARRHISSKKLVGSVSVSTWDGKSLPYVDNLVNLLVALNGKHSLSDIEVERVLAPGGRVAMRRQTELNLKFDKSGNWFVYRKAVPDSIDTWSHHMYDSTGIGAGNDFALGLPRHLQWKAGPEFSRSHENMSSVSVVVSDGGRVFSIMDEGPLASIYLPSKWYLTARDAFSGVLLWKKPIESWHARLFPLKSGPIQLPRRLVASGGHVYVTLGLDAAVSKIDAATGKILSRYSAPQHAEELLYVGGKLIVVSSKNTNTVPYEGRMPANRPDFSLKERILVVQSQKSVTVIDTSKDRILWSSDCGELVPLTIVADEKLIFFMTNTSVKCLALNTGTTIWDKKIADKNLKITTYHSPTVLLHKDIVYVALNQRLKAMDVRNGDELWTAQCANAGYGSPASIFILNNLIWDINTSGEPYRPKSKVLPNKANRTYVGFDLRTGEIHKELPIYGEQGYGVMHHRCHVPRASGDYILTGFPGIEFIDTNSGDVKHHSWIRGACLYGFMPANGLIYAPPHPCACYMQSKLSGFLAVAPARKDEDIKPTRKEPKLVKGPAFGKAVYGKTQDSESWPMYRGDTARSGRYTGTIPTILKRAWKKQFNGKLTQPIISEGRLFTVSAEERKLFALDVDSGNILWSYNVGGKVDSAPTCHKGMVIFGCRDGYVYNLRASDGELIWRFRAAPEDRRLVSYNQVESVWPVHGSVLVQSNVLWFVAGRSSFLDGGLYVYRLDPDTGRELSMTNVLMLGADGGQPPILSDSIHPVDIGGRRAATRLDMAGAKPDVMSCDGEHVFMRHYTFDMKGKSIGQDIDHLFSATGFLDDSWFRRTYWIYGNNYVSGAQGWAWTGNHRPSGRIMSIGSNYLYGFGRDKYPPSPGNAHQMYASGEKEVFFAINKPNEITGKTDKEARRSRPQEGNSENKQVYEWSVPGDLQVRAMLLANNDKTLFVAGAKGDWITSQDAYEGRLGSTFRIISTSDGKTMSEYELSSPPVFDGISAANGKLYMAMEDGSIQCLSKK